MDILDAACHTSREQKRKAKWHKRQDALKVRNVSLNADSEAAAHPLVKDARFLKTSFFPAALPECFANME